MDTPHDNWNSLKNVNSSETQGKPLSHQHHTQIVDSDDEADESMLIPKKAAKGGSSKQNCQQCHKKTEDTSSTNNLNSMNSDSDENLDSPEEKEETGALASSQVSDFLCVSLRMGADIATKVENYWRRLKATTKDLRICGKDDKGSHPFKNTSVDGWYCKFCL